MNLGLAILLGALAVAAGTDMRERRVPNAVVFTGAAAAFLFHGLAAPGKSILAADGGGMGAVASIAGMVIAFIVLLPLYVLRAMGAGDVKLMMMVGAFLGPLQTFGVVVLTFAAGGVLAIAMVLWRRSFSQLAMNLRFMLTTSAVKAATGESPKFEPLQHTAGRMPYAVAIFAGTLLQLILVRSGGWALS